MFLKSIVVQGFLGRADPLRVDFNRDLNIFTGRNGAGKTMLLKLIWYMMSGNILPALKEVSFKQAQLSTDMYECTLVRLGQNTCRVDLRVGETSYEFEDVEDDDGDVVLNAEDRANDFLEDLGSSVFFPTFRRIEGGFTLNTSTRNVPSLTNSPFRPAREKNDVEEALTALARKLTNQSHTFVTSISTVDIVGLLLRRYADLSEQSSKIQEQRSQEIIEQIRHYELGSEKKKNKSSAPVAADLLAEIRKRIEETEKMRALIMSPINAIQEVMFEVIKYSGIQFGGRLSFGDAASAVNSDVLSAGEKQMLSFVAYNGFYSDTMVFIDEPELSLHVDWQRQLFTTLMRQQSSNQFIVATHSPFIFGKFPDKEVQLISDRGFSAGGT
jgi:predicted ATPase